MAYYEFNLESIYNDIKNKSYYNEEDISCFALLGYCLLLGNNLWYALMVTSYDLNMYMKLIYNPLNNGLTSFY